MSLRKRGISTCGELNSPEASTVKVYHHPLGRVKGEGVGVLDALQEPPELRAQKGCACIGSVNVEPQPLTGTWESRCRLLQGRHGKATTSKPKGNALLANTMAGCREKI